MRITVIITFFLLLLSGGLSSATTGGSSRSSNSGASRADVGHDLLEVLALDSLEWQNCKQLSRTRWVAGKIGCRE